MCWSWYNAGETIKDIAPLLTAAAAWFAAFTAWKGLNKWRDETIGKRRAELAEDVLSAFYQMRDIIAEIRSPVVFGDEGQNRQVADEDKDDSTSIMQAKNNYYVPIARYNDRQKVIADLMAKRYRMIAMFGSAAAQPFNLLQKVFSNITGSAQKLIIAAGKTDIPKQDDPRRIWESYIRWGAENDPIDKDVQSMIAAIESICSPVLEVRK